MVVTFLSLIDRLKFPKYLSELNKRNDKKILDKNNKSLLHLRTKCFGNFSSTMTQVLNHSDYVPNVNEKLVLENGLKLSIPFINLQRENILSEFEILSG